MELKKSVGLLGALVGIVGAGRVTQGEMRTKKRHEPGTPIASAAPKPQVSDLAWRKIKSMPSVIDKKQVGANQRKRRKLIRQNPTLLRGRYKKYSKR